VCPADAEDLMTTQTSHDLRPRETPRAAAGAVAFPEGQKAGESPIFTRNELFIAAPAERVWGWLVRAASWPEWYGNAKDVEIDGGARDLAPGTRFHWTTFGVRVHTTITEWVPGRRLAWSGHALGSTAYHGWVITPCDGGCVVVTEETQQGLVPYVGRAFLRPGLLKWHQRWLEGLARVATQEAPPVWR
jgi:hypothetical protein